MASASKTIPFVVPPQVVPIVEPITQDELTLLLSLRGRLSQLESQVETAEDSIKQRLGHGASVEPGDHTATLKDQFRRNIAWKEVVVRLAQQLKLDGAMYCDRVLAATKPTRTVSVHVE